MKRSIKILVTGSVQIPAYKELIQKQANKLRIEGCIQCHDKDGLLIFACGAADHLDELIDHIYKGTNETEIRDVLIEPYLNEKVFRGVFRIIE